MRYLRQSEVTPEMTAWAIAIDTNPDNDFGYTEVRDFNGKLVKAVIEHHTEQARTGRIGDFKGVSLYAGEPDKGHVQEHDLVRVEGVDVSDYQGIVDFKRVKAAGKEFVWIKATEGVSGHGSTQEHFRENAKRARDEGLLIGFYHYMRATPPIDQAKHFLDVVSGLDPELPPVLDAEELSSLVKGGPKQDPTAFGNACAAWLDYVDQQWVHPVLYTMPGFWNSLPDVGVGKLAALWVANWTQHPTPLPVKGFDTWWAWQYTASGIIPGINGKADVNRFNCTKSELLTTLGVEA